MSRGQNESQRWEYYTIYTADNCQWICPTNAAETQFKAICIRSTDLTKIVGIPTERECTATDNHTNCYEIQLNSSYSVNNDSKINWMMEIQGTYMRQSVANRIYGRLVLISWIRPESGNKLLKLLNQRPLPWILLPTIIAYREKRPIQEERIVRNSSFTNIQLYLKGKRWHRKHILPALATIVEQFLLLAYLPKSQASCTITVRITNPFYN